MARGIGRGDGVAPSPSPVMMMQGGTSLPTGTGLCGGMVGKSSSSSRSSEAQRDSLPGVFRLCSASAACSSKLRACSRTDSFATELRPLSNSSSASSSSRLPRNAERSSSSSSSSDSHGAERDQEKRWLPDEGDCGDDGGRSGWSLGDGLPAVERGPSW